MGQIAIRVRPGSSRDQLEWEPWRNSWVVRCRARPVEGAANDRVAELMAVWLAVPRSSVRWVSGLRSTVKRMEVDGLSGAEIVRRMLLASSERKGRPP